ncbi:N(4)-(beta-N-acetylglucosaminyl)-L-asparaginase [Bacteroidota bacterium]
MIKRRSFIRKLSLTSAIAGLGMYQSFGSQGVKPGKPVQSLDNDPLLKFTLPMVIATWPNQEATRAAMDVLKNGGRALDAVEAGAWVPEGNPNDMSVGYGGIPDKSGDVTLDACIMDEHGAAGSVTYLKHIKHPISVARKVMEETQHVMLSGQGALEFALTQGFKRENLLTAEAIEKWEELKASERVMEIHEDNHDTIGILAIDNNENISGACTTSGMAYKMPGRVGDSPILGAGMFCDNEVGGACATGTGELVMKTLGSFLIVELMRQGISPQEACEEAIKRIFRKKQYRPTDQVGYLAVNKEGEVGAFGLRGGFYFTVFSGGENKVYKSDSLL